jgi:pimeloyl-ACP methyl ester carboxylesterase
MKRMSSGDESAQRKFIISIDDERFFSLRDSGGGGVPLLLLHGIPGYGGAWEKVVSKLPTGYRTIVPDLLGFGGSARPTEGADLHAAAQAEGLAALLDRLDIKKTVVVGHDFGGPVALWLTRLRPGLVTHLGLVAANVMPDTPIPPPLNLLRMPFIGRIIERVLMSPGSLRMMVGRGVGRPVPMIDRAAYVGDKIQARAIRTIFAMSLRNLRELYTPTQAALSALDIPVFVAWGDRDPFFKVEEGQRIADASTGASFTIFKDAGHFLPEERPRELVELIVKLTTGGNAR